MKKTLALIGCIILLLLAAAVFLFSIGTVFTAIPYIGSIANIITVGWLHLWLPLCVVLSLIGLGLCLANRKKPVHWVILALSVVSLAATVFFLCQNASALKQYGVKPNVFLSKEDLSAVRVETFPYTQSEYGPVYLDAYYTEDGKTDKPVLIYIHGGGWIQGSRETHAYYPKVFANHGYVAFTLEYDLSTPERHLAESTELQIAEAFAWVKNHAADFGGDITQLCVAGGSAGGNLALELAYKINAGIYQTAADGTELPTVRAASVTFPAASVVAVYNNDDLVLGNIVHNMAASYTGCSPEENPALYESLAPANAISANTPPTNIVLGAGDVIVPPKDTYDLDAALEKAGIPHQTVTIPYANHGFDAVDGNMSTNAYLDLSLRWFEQYLGNTGDK
ncbi:MAG: alpha/beta hydrolase [Oscillospiraceae bacterium]|nr:alpha/beta hydrolase [Oscillospiraceae bacterium]